MTKFTPSSISNIGGNPTSAANEINQNFNDVSTAMEKTLSRDGTSPNQMEADLDLNNNDILNVSALDVDALTVAGIDIHDIVGLPGPTGPAGPTGATGPTGNTGPQGATGSQGPAATVAIGTTTTISAGQPATVTNVGTSGAAVLNFGIPQGVNGTGSGTVTSVAASTPTGLSVSGSPIIGSGTLSFTYSAGYQGYTTTEATKLSGIAAGAEVNVNADWNAGSGDAQILNKPTLSAVATSGAYSSLSGLPTLGTSSAFDWATTAEYRTGTATKVLRDDQVWAAAATVALTDASSVVLNLANGLNFTLTIGGNRTLANPTTPKVGQTGCIQITQDGSGSRTLAYGTQYKWAGGTPGVLSTTAGALDVLYYQVLTSTSVLLTLVNGVA